MHLSRKLKLTDSIDRISDLPDSIICKILSLLPTKNVVATCILSKRWNNLDPFGYSPIILNLDDSLILHPAEPDTTTSFKHFMDKLLHLTLRDVPCVRRMNLKCKKQYSDADIVSWVSAALNLNVRMLRLNFVLEDTDTLFQSLNGCKTLVTLELVMDCGLSIPGGFSLPSLKILCFRDVHFDEFHGSSAADEFIDGCPVLEHLSMFDCKFMPVWNLNIWSTSLKNLFITSVCLDSDTELELHTPNLEWLMYSGYVAGGYSITSFESLKTADIDIGVADEDLECEEDALNAFTNVAMVVGACSNVKFLSVSGWTLAALHYLSLQPPLFQNLTRLALGFVRSEGWAVLACILNNAPKLNHLLFQEEFETGEMGYEDFECLMPSPPICLEQHLKKIEFWDFDVKGDEFKLLKYFLDNEKVLETVEFNSVEIHIKKQSYVVWEVDSSSAISPPSSSSSPPYSILVELTMKMVAERATRRVEWAKRQVGQFQQLSERTSNQLDSMVLMMNELLESKTPLATTNLTMCELLECKEQLAMIDFSDLPESLNHLESKNRLISHNQKLIEMMNTLMKSGLLPAQAPSQPLPATDSHIIFN